MMSHSCGHVVQNLKWQENLRRGNSNNACALISETSTVGGLHALSTYEELLQQVKCENCV